MNLSEAFIGPTVWELLGPMPILNNSSALINIRDYTLDVGNYFEFVAGKPNRVGGAVCRNLKDDAIWAKKFPAEPVV